LPSTLREVFKPLDAAAGFYVQEALVGRSYAGILGTLAFLSVLARCLLESGSAASTLKLAIASLFAFAALGYAIGQLADFVIWDAVRSKLDQEMSSQAPPRVASGKAGSPSP
jgi:hypothetical protein